MAFYNDEIAVSTAEYLGSFSKFDKPNFNDVLANVENVRMTARSEVF